MLYVCSFRADNAPFMTIVIFARLSVWVFDIKLRTFLKKLKSFIPLDLELLEALLAQFSTFGVFHLSSSKITNFHLEVWRILLAF